MRRVAMGAASAVLAAVLTACGTAPSPTAEAATVKACKTIQAWYASDASGFFTGSAASTAARLDAKNTPLEAALSDWLSDMQSDDWPQSSQDSDKVFAVCGGVGVSILPN